MTDTVLFKALEAWADNQTTERTWEGSGQGSWGEQLGGLYTPTQPPGPLGLSTWVLCTAAGRPWWVFPPSSGGCNLTPRCWLALLVSGDSRVCPGLGHITVTSTSVILQLFLLSPVSKSPLSLAYQCGHHGRDKDVLDTLHPLPLAIRISRL